MTKIVILEGEKYTGKSFIAERLLQSLSFGGEQVRLWKSERGSDPKRDMMVTIMRDFTKFKGVVVADRFHLSEYAYGLATRGVSRLQAERDFLFIDRILHDAFPVFCVCLFADDGVRGDRAMERDGTRDLIGNSTKLSHYFADACTLSKFSVGLRNETILDTETNIDFINWKARWWYL